MNRKNNSIALTALAALTFSGNIVSAQDVLVPTSAVAPGDNAKLRPAQMPARPKIGFALGGGGARGAAEVGVMEVLEAEGIRPDFIVGTSIGSIVGGLYDAGVPLSTLRKEFETGRAMRHFMPVPLLVGIMLQPVLLSGRLVHKTYDGAYPGYSFKKYLQKVTPKDHTEIQSLKIPYAAVALNLADGKPYMIRGGSLVEAMRASSAVPGLRKPIKISDKLFVDGGVVCNVPVKQCREMGADIVIAVNIDEPFEDVPTSDFYKFGSVERRMINWDLYKSDKPQAELADIVIHPDTAGIHLVTTSKKCAREGLAAGRKAAEDALPAIREKLRSLGFVADDAKTKAN